MVERAHKSLDIPHTSINRACQALRPFISSPEVEGYFYAKEPATKRRRRAAKPKADPVAQVHNNLGRDRRDAVRVLLQFPVYKLADSNTRMAVIEVLAVAYNEKFRHLLATTLEITSHGQATKYSIKLTPNFKSAGLDSSIDSRGRTFAAPSKIDSGSGDETSGDVPDDEQGSEADDEADDEADAADAAVDADDTSGDTKALITDDREGSGDHNAVAVEDE